MARIADLATQRFMQTFKRKTEGNLRFFTSKFTFDQAEYESQVVQEPIAKEKAQYEGPTRITEQPITKPNRSRPDIVILNMATSERIVLPWIPDSLSYEPNSKLVAIPSVGRNNPFYHYTGSEDTLEFVIDWFFTNDESRQMAYNRATQIEALSKADGYLSELPQVKLIWGESRLFRGSLWLVEKAEYKLSQWLNKAPANIGSIYRMYKDFGLMPQQIIQNIKLKKVTEHNLTHFEISKDREVYMDGSYIDRLMNNSNPIIQ